MSGGAGTYPDTAGAIAMAVIAILAIVGCIVLAIFCMKKGKTGGSSSNIKDVASQPKMF